MRKRLSFFTLLFLGNIFLVGVIVAIVGLVSWHRLDREYQRSNEAQQRNITRIVQKHFESVWPRESDAVDETCGTMAADSAFRITVIAADGLVLGDSHHDPRDMENHRTLDRPEILAALDGTFGDDVRRSETLNVMFRYYALPIRADGRVAAVARVARQIRDIAEGSGLLRSALIWGSLLAVLTAVLLAFILSWIWYLPLRHITRSARQIASGQLDKRVAIRGSSEVTQLSNALNEMRKNLSSQIDMIAEQRANLDTVLNNLHEGVVALDGEARMVFANEAAVGLLNIESLHIHGTLLQDHVRLADAIDAVNRTIETGKTTHRQIAADVGGLRGTLDLTCVPVSLRQSGGITAILVVRDVTEQARMAEIKSEFVANASHELRTPLSTIRAAVDSLKSTGPSDARAFEKFVDILDRHTSRLEMMSNDLLDLNMVEKASRHLESNTVTAASLGQGIRDHFTDKAFEKGVEFQVRVTGEKMPFRTDPKLVRLILQNLVDNALKFTSRGGRVACSIAASEELLTLSVADTGCGISPEMQDRVFERFFQAESSRSGDSVVRGTGLGLAIVKHAAERLEAGIDLSSTPGEGTTFSVRIPPTPEPQFRGHHT